MITAIYMLRASGAIDMFAYAVKPLYAFLGIPPECAALTLLKPFSGSGGLALGTEIIKNFGADSYAGRVAAVMLASSETSFYTVSVYFGSLGIKNTRYAIPAALCADAVAFIVSSLAVRLFF
ncbi:MAG: spore maturation protein, partial [Bacillota bacterium]|nr:spore maturation protein [Bacillota bacterium]